MKQRDAIGTAVRSLAVLAAALVLTQTGFAATGRSTSATRERAASTPSTTMAGYAYNYYIGVPGAISATIVVPKLNCTGTPTAGSAINAGVGIQSVNSYARLTLACTAQGTAQYFPSLDINGTIRNFQSDAAQTGDTVEFAVSQSSSQDTVSVIDLTHKFMAAGNGNGSGTGEGIIVGDFPAVSGSTTLGVPNFGNLTFSSALVNGLAFGLAPKSGTSGLQAYDLSTSSTGPVQIKSTGLGSNKQTVVTVFKHS
jgi:hypothetical protein